MSEVIEIYFELAYRIIRRIFFRKKFLEQDNVPLYIKIISTLVPITIFVLLVWFVIEINN
jgi:hypothetical protein